MKIVVTAQAAGLEAQVDPRFGRCSSFVIVDTETMETESVPNENVIAAGGAGVQAAQLMSDKGAEAVLTGNCGPNAYRTLREANIEVIVGVKGTVAEAVEKFKAGAFESTDEPSVDAKFGV